MVLPSIQIEKKMPFMPPSCMRGMSMVPSVLRLPRSKADFERKRCVVSSCVSMTMEEKWRLDGRERRCRSAVTSRRGLRAARLSASKNKDGETKEE